MRAIRFLTLAVGLALLAPAPGWAQTSYSIQPIVGLGGRATDVLIAAVDGYFEIGSLNDVDQLVFVTHNAAGGEALIQFANGRLTPIVAAGKSAPGGTWSQDVVIMPPVQMNQLGDVVFAAGGFDRANLEFNTFLWSFRAQRVTPVALKGRVVSSNLTLGQGGGPVPSLNLINEIALVAEVKNAAGQVKDGVFVVGRDGTMLPVALPDQVLPDGSRVVEACCPTINNAGVISFLVQRQGDGDNAWSGYLWDAGTITPVAIVGTTTTGGARIGTVWAVTVNDRNRNVLVEAATGTPNGPNGIYWFAGGRLASVALPGQAMPGGGVLAKVHGTSFPNLVGQHAFWATLNDTATAAYLIEPSGALSLIVKSGMTTPLGQITNVGQGSGLSHGVALNSSGEVAVTVRIGAGSDTIVLLTPVVQGAQ